MISPSQARKQLPAARFLDHIKSRYLLMFDSWTRKRCKGAPTRGTSGSIEDQLSGLSAL